MAELRSEIKFEIVRGAESTTFLLPRLVGFHRAMELVLLGSRLSGRQAQEWGLINAVYPDASFAEDVRALATRLAALPAGAVATASAAAPTISGGVARSPCDRSRTVQADVPTIRANFHQRPSRRPNRIIVGITAASSLDPPRRLRPRLGANPLVLDAACPVAAFESRTTEGCAPESKGEQ